MKKYILGGGIMMACFASLLMSCANDTNIAESPSDVDDYSATSENIENSEEADFTFSVEDALNEYGLSIEQKDVHISGISSEYYFLWLSDQHILMDSDEYIEKWGVTTSERQNSFMNEQGISSNEQFTAWIDICNHMNIDQVLLSGDIIDYLTEDNVAYVAQQLERLQKPYLYVMGNHDSYDVFDIYGGGFQDENELLTVFWKNNNVNCQIVDGDEFYLVGIDDSGNRGHAEVSEEAYVEFLKIYQIAKRENKPILLMCHVPLTTDNTEQLKNQSETLYNTHYLLGNNLDYALDEYTQEFYNIVLADNSPVELIMSGHVHFESDDYLTDNIRQIISGPSSRGTAILVHIIPEGGA